jgi:hypothetical protein
MKIGHLFIECNFKISHIYYLVSHSYTRFLDALQKLGPVYINQNKESKELFFVSRNRRFSPDIIGLKS